MKLRPYLHLGLAAALTLGALSANADYATTLSSLNPLGYWRLNEPSQPVVPTYPMTNSSAAGNALNGDYFGVPLLGQPGALSTDNAVNLNGVSQYAQVSNNAACNPSGPFTVEFWANLTNVSAGAKSGVVSRYITVAGGPTGQFGYLFFANNGNSQWQFRVYNGTAGVTVTDPATALQADTWYHVVGVYDGSQIQIYVNGVASATPVVATCVVNTNTPLRIGAGTTETAPSLFFPGYLDEVAIYPTALTPDQIYAHYDAATTNAAGYAAQVQSLNPNAYWKLNEPTVPPYVPYMATNAGSLGSAQDGTYSIFGSTSGVAGPLRGQFAGFETDNRSVALNGSSGLISIPGFATSTDTATFVGWIKRSGSQGNASPIILQRAAGSPATGLVVDFNNRLGYVWNDDAATYSFNPGADFFIPDNVWTFAAVSISPTEATMYIGSTNGLRAITRTGAHAPHDFSFGPLQIGRDGTSTGRAIRGNLDEVAIIGSALDAATVSNLFYSATPALLTVTRTPANPVYEGVNVTFTAYAASSAPANYQWRRNGTPVGGNSSVLALNNVTPANDGNYDVIVTVGSQSVTSVVDTITVIAGPPVVVTPPASLTRYVGGSATFSVVAAGTTPFTYQWREGTTDIPDATNASYTIPSVTLANATNYSVRITNPNGNLTSAAATLTVLPASSSYAGAAMHRQADHYWSLNETSGTNAFDYAGGLNGTFPAPPVVTPGAVGPRTPDQPGFDSGNTAYQLDGVTGWITCPPLNWNTNAATFSAWVYLTGYDDGLSGVVFSRGTSASGIHIGNTGELGYHWDDGQWAFSSGLFVPLNEWVFLALVVEPNQGTLYMGTSNELASAVNSATHDAATLTDPLYLGRDRTDRPLVGRIDEAAVFQYSLSLNDVSALYAIGFGVPLNLSITPGGIIQDTKPVGTPHNGYNYSTGWSNSVTDLTVPTPITRTGVAKFDTALSSQILVPADPDFDSATGTFTFWMRADAPIPGPGDEGAILVDRRTDNGTVIVLNDAGNIFVQCAGGANSFAAGYLPDGNWHNVAVTYDQSVSGSLEIFVDGVSLGAQPNTAAWTWPTTQPIELGRSHDSYWKRYDGNMDDFRIYNRVLTPAEIASVASSGAVVDSAALKVRYDFDNTGIGYTVSWPFGTLQATPVLGPSATWTNVPGANPPSIPVLPTEGAQFFRAAY